MAFWAVTSAVGDINIAKHINVIINPMFIIIAVVAYVPPMFLINFLAPICIAQMPKINARQNVNNTELKPKKNADVNVTVTYDAIVFVGRARIQF